MRMGVADLALRCAQRLDDAVRSDIANQPAGGARYQPAQGSSDAAALCETKQCRNAGRSRHADLDRHCDAAGRNCLSQPKMRSGENENWLTI